MSLLPTRCLEHILNRLPLTNVYRVMCVCREWHSAAAVVIREWPVLEIKTHKKNGCSEKAKVNAIILNHSTDDKQIIASLMRMHHLYRLFYETSTHIPALDMLVMQNVSSLNQLIYPTLPLEPGLSYPMLQRLKVWTWNGEDAKAIAVAIPNIQWLDISFGGEDIMNTVMVAIPESYPLTELSLCLQREFRSLMLLLFFAFHRLKLFRLNCSNCSWTCNLTEHISILVKQNPGLMDIMITGGEMTDEVLHHVARLQHLWRLKLNPVQGVFTADALCVLLNGRSRTCLMDVSIKRNTTDVSEQQRQRLSQEIERMAQETGRWPVWGYTATDSLFEFFMPPATDH